MAAVDFKFCVLPRFEGNRLLLLRDGRRGPDGAAEDHRHAVGDAAVHAARVVRFGDDLAVRHAEGVVGPAAAHRRKAEALAEFHALHRRHGEKQLTDRALHAVKEGRAKACGQASRHAFDHAL